VSSRPLPRLRTLDAAYALLKEIDPETSLTRHALRRLAVAGVIPVVQLGAKRLIDVDALCELIASDPASLSLSVAEGAPGTLRRVTNG